jgi:hypothetical protein
MKRNVFKNTASVLAGFVFIAGFCFLTDRALQWAGILPVPGKVKFDDEHALLHGNDVRTEKARATSRTSVGDASRRRFVTQILRFVT